MICSNGAAIALANRRIPCATPSSLSASAAANTAGMQWNSAAPPPATTPPRCAAESTLKERVACASRTSRSPLTWAPILSSPTPPVRVARRRIYLGRSSSSSGVSATKRRSRETSSWISARWLSLATMTTPLLANSTRWVWPRSLGSARAPPRP